MIRTLFRSAVAGAALILLPSCGGGFDPASKIQSVRVLGLRADKPYAKPGDTVTLEVLAVDRRPEEKRQRPMTVFWLPLVCTNPPNDAYYACFTRAAKLTSPTGEPTPGAGAGGADGAADITALVAKGQSFSYKIPGDAVSSHVKVPGANGDYGISIVFYMACAGRIRLASRDEASANPQQVPIQCVDDDGQALGADDYVLGFWRTFVYDDRPNANPLIDNVLLKTDVIGPGAAVAITPCADGSSGQCKGAEVNVVVPASSQEDKPYDPDAPRERIWVAAFSDVASVGGAQQLLYDTKAGAIRDNPVRVTATSGDLGKSGTLWLVVHDSRGGATWTTVPLLVTAAP